MSRITLAPETLLLSSDCEHGREHMAHRIKRIMCESVLLRSLMMKVCTTENQRALVRHVRGAHIEPIAERMSYENFSLQFHLRGYVIPSRRGAHETFDLRKTETYVHLPKYIAAAAWSQLSCDQRRPLIGVGFGRTYRGLLDHETHLILQSERSEDDLRQVQRDIAAILSSHARRYGNMMEGTL